MRRRRSQFDDELPSVHCAGGIARRGNEILLLRHDNGLFGFLKGHPEPDESGSQTAEREVREESGWVFKALGELGTVKRASIEANGHVVMKHMRIFVGQLVELDLSSKPDEKAVFVPIADAIERMLPEDAALLREHSAAIMAAPDVLQQVLHAA